MKPHSRKVADGAFGGIPSQDELLLFLRGELDRKRSVAISSMIESHDKRFSELKGAVRDLQQKLRSLPGPRTARSSERALRRLHSRLRTVRERPQSGDVWKLKDTDREVVVLLTERDCARVAPLTREYEFAGPRDVVIRHDDVAPVPVLVELFASAWVRSSNLEMFLYALPEGFVAPVCRADRGVYDGLPRQLKRGELVKDSALESFHAAWRESERRLIARVEVPLSEVMAEQPALEPDPLTVAPSIKETVKEIVLTVKEWIQDPEGRARPVLGAQAAQWGAAMVGTLGLFARGLTANVISELLRVEMGRDVEGKSVFQVFESDRISVWLTRHPAGTLYLRAEMRGVWKGRTGVDRVVVAMDDNNVLADGQSLPLRQDQLAWELPPQISRFDTAFRLSVTVAGRTEAFRIEPRRVSS